MCIGIHRYKIGIIYKKKNESCEVEEVVCVCVWKKKRGGGGGVELHMGVGHLIYIISDFCFTSFETFFF